MIARRFITIAVACITVGCIAGLRSVGGAAPSARVPAPAAGSHAAHPNGSVVFRIKVPRLAKPTSAAGSRRARPQYVSVSTESFAVLTDGKNPVVANVDPATGYAAVVVNAPVGIHTFTVTAYDQFNAAGNVLSTGTTAPVYVPAQGQVGVSITLEAVVASVALTLAHTNVTVGSAATIDLEVLAMDADGNTILGLQNDLPTNTVFAQPFTLTSSDPANGKLSQTTIAKAVNEFPGASQGISVTYTGANVSRITFSATGRGLRSVVPAVLVPLVPPPSGEQIIVTPGDLISSFSTPYGFQLLATFGQLQTSPNESYGSAAVDAAAGLLYVMGDFPTGTPNVFAQRFGIFQTGGAHALVDTFDPHLSPTDLAIDPAAGRVFVSTTQTRDVSTFSTLSGHAPAGSIHSGFWGADLVADPIAHRLYVGGCGVSCGGAGLNVFSTIPPYAALASLTNGPRPLAMAVGGGKLYVEEFPPQSAFVYVDVYDAATLIRLARIGPVGFPGGVAVDVAGRRLYVLSQASNDPSPYLGISPVQVYGLEAGFPLLGTFASTSGGNWIVVAPYIR